MLGLLACTPESGPANANTTSSSFATLPEKVAFLERYVTFRRHYEQLEYGVFYQNNGGGCVPGPSEWDLTIVARVPSHELDAWTSDLERVSTRPPELTNLASELDTSGVSEWYEALGKTVGVDRSASIVMYRATAR